MDRGDLRAASGRHLECADRSARARPGADLLSLARELDDAPPLARALETFCRHDPDGAVAGGGPNQFAWAVGGNKGCQLAIGVNPYVDAELLIYVPVFPFQPTMANLEALRALDDATDGFLTQQLIVNEGHVGRWLREMIHRDRGVTEEETGDGDDE